MPSSISSFERHGLVGLTASDRPGVAQPVPERLIPARPWPGIMLAALLLGGALLGGWEWYWRDFGATPGLANSDSHWAEQRRRINSGEGGNTVLVGSSRMLFDVQLDEWASIDGTRPIQLALEGTSAVPALEDLAADPDFTGKLLVDVSPDLFFSGHANRMEAIKSYPRQGPSQRIGHWLSQQLVEPYWAFDDPDYALATVIKRQAWPLRPGRRERMAVRKLMVQEAGRNSHIWRKVEEDAAYRALARSIWAQNFKGPPPGLHTPALREQVINKQIGRAVAAVKKLQARGVRVVFVRPPSIDDFYASENRNFPRAATWDVLLQRSGAPGIHFEDYAALQSRDLPEWSHLSHAAARSFTRALVPLAKAKWEEAPGAR